MDHPVLSGREYDFGFTGEHGGKLTLAQVLEELKEVAIETNEEWADKLGIPRSTAITCVKPSGTVSQLVNSSSGIHPRYSAYYIRRVRADAGDPIAHMLLAQGVPFEKDKVTGSTLVFSFPIKSPKGAITEDDISAIDMLKLWKVYQDNWCEHKPSVTVHYKDEEFLALGDFVYNNFNSISGISFLPKSTHTYEQAPYEAISEEKYNELEDKMPIIDFNQLSLYEEEDNTAGTQTLACTGSSCELVDLVKH
jgi:ribonucleoside-diphosphate reductase alpha chain